MRIYAPAAWWSWFNDAVHKTSLITLDDVQHFEPFLGFIDDIGFMWIISWAYMFYLALQIMTFIYDSESLWWYNSNSSATNQPLNTSLRAPESLCSSAERWNQFKSTALFPAPSLDVLLESACVHVCVPIKWSDQYTVKLSVPMQPWSVIFQHKRRTFKHTSLNLCGL